MAKKTEPPMKYQYPCPVCGGGGMIVCDCCGNDTDCDDCDASGLDVARVDVEKFNEAEKAARKLHDSSSWSLMENGIAVGRCGGILGAPPVWSLRYDDFLRGDAVTANRRRGFTISEMLAVVVIVSMLVAVIVPGLSGAREAARDARCLHDLRSIHQAVTEYRVSSPTYPRTWDHLGLVEGVEPRACPRRRDDPALDGHGLWSPVVATGIGGWTVRTFEAIVDHAPPPGPLVASDLTVWAGAKRNGVWRDGNARRIRP